MSHSALHALDSLMRTAWYGQPMFALSYALGVSYAYKAKPFELTGD